MCRYVDAEWSGYVDVEWSGYVDVQRSGYVDAEWARWVDAGSAELYACLKKSDNSICISSSLDRYCLYL